MNDAAISAMVCKLFGDYRIHWGPPGLRIVLSLVDVMSKSLAEDLGRFELFHKSENSETHKQAAFMVYWMSKVKPIATEQHHKQTAYITANETFAFALAMRLLDIAPERISNEFIEEFVYSLYFRDTSPRQMFYTFMMLDRLNKAVPGLEQIV